MKHLNKFFILFFIVILSQANAQINSNQIKTNTEINYNYLRKGFLKTPNESHLRCYWWWLNSMVTKESISRDLKEMKAKGYGGASIVDAGSSNYKVAKKTPAGPVYLSPEWMELYKYAVKEADRFGIELSVNVGSGWNPGGPMITPEFAMKKLVWSETNIMGGKTIRIRLPEPKSNLMYKDVMVQAIKNLPDDSPVKDKAIKYWSKKSLNTAMGWKGVYPLYQLRERYPDSVRVHIISKNDIVDITSCLKGDMLKWNAPEGSWTIIRYGWTCTGAHTSTSSDGWEGLSLDHLNPEAFELFGNTVIRPLIETAQSVGHSVKFLQTDSWEMGMVNWTNNFPEDFKIFRGYDIQEYMPVLTGRVVESRDVSNRFLHDIRETVGDCVADYHYQKFSDLAHRYGLGIHPESGGPHSAPVDALRVMAISDIPQGEFWARSNSHRITDAARLSVKQSACVAHTNGKRFVAAEGPTSIGPQWERAPKDLKGVIDRIFCAGVNRIVWHTFTASPKEFGIPGDEYFAGTHLNPNVTWWKQAGDFIDYLNRCSYMLQQGLFVADVLYYYGDDVPNFVFLKDEYKELDKGYNWDKCSKDVLFERASVKNGKLILPDGMSYRVLVLPNKESINLEILKKVEKLVKAGLTVIAPRPNKSTGLTNYPESDREVEEIAKKMWGRINGTTITENRYGKGRMIWGQDINEVLSKMNVLPDLKYKGTNEKTRLDFIHRTTDNQEIYFVVNRFGRKGINDFKYRYLTDLPDRYEQVECKFRVAGKVAPELWDPLTGKVIKLYIYREENGYTIIPLHFEPEGSKFIIFRKNLSRPHITKISKDGRSFFPDNKFETKSNPYIEILSEDNQVHVYVSEPGVYELNWSDGNKSIIKAKTVFPEQIISGSWELSFNPVWGGPEKIVINELKSWTEFKEAGIKYYSGTGTYYKTFSLNKKEIKNNKLLLDLGNVQEMASIKINGQQMPVKWCAPFVFDITKYAKAGENTLKVEVVNMWPNRLIGDGKLPKKERLTKTNINKFNTKDAEKYLRKSGLLGPVRIIFEKNILL